MAATVSPNLMETESVLRAFLLSKTEHTTSTRIEVSRNSVSKPCNVVISGCTVVTHMAQQEPFGLCCLSIESGVTACNKEGSSCVYFEKPGLQNNGCVEFIIT